MSKLRVNCFSISLDGYGAGPDQSLENPLGVGAPAEEDIGVQRAGDGLAEVLRHH